MKFIKLNHEFNADPNAPEETAMLVGPDVILEFGLNAFAFERFQEGDRGRLIFKNCYKYRLGPTNDEGWYRGQCRYSKMAPRWGEFYLIENSDWRNFFPADALIVNPQLNSLSELKHFLFYLRDNTFEAICGNYCFETST